MIRPAMSVSRTKYTTHTDISDCNTPTSYHFLNKGNAEARVVVTGNRSLIIIKKYTNHTI